MAGQASPRFAKPMAPLSHCAAEVREHDPDRYLATLFAPADAREALFALYAFDHEITRVRRVVSEPVAGSCACSGGARRWTRSRRTSRPLPVVAAVHARWDRFALRPRLEAAIQAREQELSSDPPADLAALELRLAASSGRSPLPPWICSASPRNRRVPRPPRPGARPGAPVARPARRSAPRARAVADHLARPASDRSGARAQAPQRRSCDQWSPISWGERASICIRRAGTGAAARALAPCCPRRSWTPICGASPAPAAIRWRRCATSGFAPLSLLVHYALGRY